MKHRYSWLVAVSALLVGGALISCESDALLGSEVPGDSSSSSKTKVSSSSVVSNVESSSSSVASTGKSSSSSLASTGKSSSSSATSTGKSSSSSAKTVYCDFGDGDCVGGYTASTCDAYGGDIVTACPVVGSSSSASGLTVSCNNSDMGICGVGVPAEDCLTENGDVILESCPLNYVNSCQTDKFMLYEYANAAITCADINSQLE